MNINILQKRGRGRPPKEASEKNEVKKKLIRVGLELLTEKGFSTTGLDEIFRRAGISKGSFYHYYASKEAFGAELIDSYAVYFARKLDYFLEDETLPHLERIILFAQDAERNMARFDYKRGCLVGNLGQEMNTLPESFRSKLKDIFKDWQARIAKCLKEGQRVGEVSALISPDDAATVFWIGWEGAVLHSKLAQTSEPLRFFLTFFIKIIKGEAK